MRRRIVLLVGMSLLAVFLSAGGYWLASASRLEVTDRFLVRLHRVATPAQQSQRAVPLTALEAWDVLVQYAAQSGEQVRVVSLSSVVGVDEPADAGQDGRWRQWQAVLRTAKTELWVTIADGAVTEVQEGPLTGGMAPMESKPQLDSPEAMAIVHALYPALTAEIYKGKGYGVVLERSSADGQGQAIPVLKVVGAWRGRSAFVELNAADASVVQARRQGLEGGGILYSSDAGLTWKASDLVGLFVADLAVDPWQGACVYAVASKGDRSVVYRSENAGRNWSELGALPELAGDWPWCLAVTGKDAADRVLLVGLESGLWSSADGRSWQLNDRLPKGGAGWLAVARHGSDYRLFATLSSGEDPGLYGSTDLVHWDRLAPTPYRLSESYDGAWVIASNDSGAQPLLLSLDSQTPMQLPPSTLRAAGDFQGAFVAFGWEDGKVARVTGGEDVVWTLETLAASLAAAPDYPTSHTIIAGGFRTGIYRSTDGGQSWQQVLADASTVVPGSNEVVVVRYVASQDVVAVNGGGLSWVGF